LHIRSNRSVPSLYTGGGVWGSNPVIDPSRGTVGSAPNEITYQTANGPKTIIGAGQKSGIYYALDPDTGTTLWETQVGPGSSLGGMEWGSASDGQRIFVAISNLYGLPYGAGSAGSWSALDPATGAILWQTPDPNKSFDIGPMTVSNGVVYASSMSEKPTAPTMFAMDARTGNILWTYTTGVSVNAGASLDNTTVYWVRDTRIWVWVAAATRPSTHSRWAATEHPS
jgi:polyvinyl alcohol dehydrogenase (cytochrome)